MPHTPTIAALRSALDSDEARLLAELGTYGNDAAPRDPIDRGLRIYSALERQLRSSICGSEQIRSLVADGSDELALATALADLLATISHQIPAATVSALLIKSGLHRYCADVWS